MKTNSIFHIFAVFILMIGIATTTVGQTNTANISAAANVVVAVTVTAGNDLQFGNVTPGNDKTIGSSDDVLQGIAAGTTPETTGTWTIDKGAKTQVTINLTLPTSLASSTGPGTYHLPLGYGDFGIIKLGAIGIVAWSPVTATDVEVTFADYPTEFDAASFTVYVGGTVAPTSNQFADSYTGTLTLTATYN
jgi:hypothetical protein